jgi:beta-galactosidase
METKVPASIRHSIFLRTMAAAAAIVLSAVGAGHGAGYVWIEGESPSALPAAFKVAGWGLTNQLSGHQWLHASIEADKVESVVPADGLLLSYRFDAPGGAGSCEVWARIGFESVRSPFDWRLDGGAWARVSPRDLTTDLVELSEWCEVAWIRLGRQALPAGGHTLDIRLPRTQDDKGKTARILFACDAICVSAGPFAPNGPHRPDAAWQTDRDRQAAANVFRVPAPATPDARLSVPLKGLWEVCRNDEQDPPADIAQPMRDVPETPFWSAIEVPGDRNALRPDLLFAHRLWYRTRIEVPASLAGRSFRLHFPQNNLNTTVLLNGQYCGFFKHPFAAFDIDVTAAVKPGVNEVWVGIRDAWYGYSTNPTNSFKLRSKFNYPVAILGRGFQDLAYPVWNHPQSGILQTPEFRIAGGPAYATDVFVKPSVKRRSLEAEVTLANPSARPVKGELRWQAVNARGAVEKTFPPQPFDLAAGATRVVALAGAWDNPKLWWPDDPNLYHLRLQLVADGAVIDTSDTRFGFREWDWSTKDFKLNGVVWHGWADCHTHDTPETWLRFYREKNETVMRFWGTTWQELPPEQALSFFDENGVVCRRSGILDGEAIGYFAVEKDPDLNKDSPIKMDLLKNWREQVAAQVRGERNHPSVLIWSLENEFLYINCINLHGNLMDLFEAEVTKTSEAVSQIDPTRPNMVDGGGATKAQTLPVQGDHYVNLSPDRYPDLAYEAFPEGGGRGRWTWDQKRPRFIGEDYFMTGNHPEVAYFEGDSAFAGKPLKGVAIWNRVLQEGYRWAGYGAWHFWHGQNDTDQSQYTAYAARAVFSRDWNWTFPAGRTVTRTFAIFNDTRHADPIVFAWQLTLGGAKVAGRSKEYAVAPGTRVTVDEPIALPKGMGRQDGEFLLTLSVGGKEVFRDVKPASVLAPQARDLAGLRAADLLVFDPHGAARGFLQAQNVACTAVTNLDLLPVSGRVLVVGRDALDARECASSRLAAYAAAGRRVIVLDQTHPLRYQGLPAEMETAQNSGQTAFLEDASHAVAANLLDRDFFTWGPGRPVYRNAYEKPGRGGRSLVQCHDRLRHTALAEVAVDKGLLLLCQLAVGEQIEANPVAQQLLLNLLGYAASYRQEFAPVAAAVADAPQLKAALDGVGLQYAAVSDALAAISRKPPATAIVAATPAALKTLAADLPAVRTFTGGGGALVLCGVTPEGLADYNRIVGVDHMMRPGKRERVTFPAVRDRLTAGLTSGDVALYTSKRIFAWTAGNYAVSDMFSHVVDFDEVASFGTSPFFAYDNIVNGFVSADGWPLIINFPKHADDSPYDVPIKLQKPQTLASFTWVGNVFYWPQTRVNLIFDGDRAKLLSFETQPNAEPQTFAIDPPRSATEVTVEIAGWTPVPDKAPNIGIDNVYFKAQRPPAFYERVHPMLNVGGLMHYTEGAGHVVLCNLLFQEREEVPENAAKKRVILAAILRNLRAPFAGGRTVLAGMNLLYEPVAIQAHCTQYRDEKGWFGDRRFTFRDLPAGDQRLAGVRFNVYEMATSPVPNVLMLAGRGIPGALPAEIRGIAVGRKADALFFLHTASIDKRRRPDRRGPGEPLELARYVVRYADGGQAELPILGEIDVEDYRQKVPATIPGAQIAWVQPYEGTEYSAVAYVKQWTNPRPDAVIASIDVLPGKDACGVPAVLAITTARAE